MRRHPAALRLRLEAIPRGHADFFRGSERARLSGERNIRPGDAHATDVISFSEPQLP